MIGQSFRKIILASFAALSLFSTISAALAQPAPVPALPDSERRTSYSITASNCSCNVNFALFGDSTDFANWVEVWLNGVRVNYNDATYGWTITSPSGSLANLARPITDGVLTFTTAQTGTVQIVGARRPRRVSQFNENTGVPARNLNQVLTDIVAMLREVWDKINDVTGRTVQAPPGETLSALPPAATRANGALGFGANGDVTVIAGALTGATVSSAMVPVVQANTLAAARAAMGADNASNLNNGTIPAALLPAGVDTNTLAGGAVITSAPTVNSTFCGTLAALGGNAQFTVTVGAASGFTSNCKIVFINTDSYTGPSSGRGKLMSISGLTNFWLMPRQKVTLRSENSVWISDEQIFVPDSSVNSIGYLARWKLPTTTVINVGGTGSSDTANDGLATGAGAFATIQHALLMACNAIDQQYQTFTIQVADGTYTTPLHLCNMVGWSTIGGHTELVLSGDTTNLGATLLSVSASGANAISMVGIYTAWRIQGFGIQTTGSAGNCIQADGHSFVYIGKNLYEGCVAAALIASYYSFLELVDNQSINNGGTYFVACQYHSLCDLNNNVTVTMSPPPAYSTAFVQAVDNSTIEAGGMTFSGSASGVRYFAYMGSVIQTNTGSASYLPGNSAGNTNCTTTSTSIGTCGFYN
jgi:hypothetical protein